MRICRLESLPCLATPSPLGTRPPPSSGAQAGAKTAKSETAPSPPSPRGPTPKSPPCADCSKTPPSSGATTPALSSALSPTGMWPRCSAPCAHSASTVSSPPNDHTTRARVGADCRVDPHPPARNSPLPVGWPALRHPTPLPRRWGWGHWTRTPCLRPWTGSWPARSALSAAWPSALSKQAPWGSMPCPRRGGKGVPVPWPSAGLHATARVTSGQSRAACWAPGRAVRGRGRGLPAPLRPRARWGRRGSSGAGGAGLPPWCWWGSGGDGPRRGFVRQGRRRGGTGSGPCAAPPSALWGTAAPCPSRGSTRGTWWQAQARPPLVRG